MHGPRAPYSDHEAKLHFRAGSFAVIVPGSYVTCAVTGKRILLDDLRYWSVERQEPYADAAAALQAMDPPR